MGARRRLLAWRAGIRIGCDMVRSWCASPTRLAATTDTQPAASVRTRPVGTTGVAIGAELRLVTWNIHRGYDGNGVARGLARLRTEVDPDLVLLQEVPVGDDGAFWQRPAVAPSLTGCALAWVPMHRVLRQDAYYDFSASGQLTAARVPLTGHQVVSLPMVSVPKLGPAHRVRRVALVVRLAVGGSQVVVANLHLENTARPAGRGRQLAALLAAIGDGPAVIAGDLNTFLGACEPLWTVAAVAGFEPLVGAPPRRLLPRLDHVLVRDLAGIACSELAIGGSDHRPLAARLRVSAGAAGGGSGVATPQAHSR